jgi:outer membrane protein assembly factor BamB
VINSRWIKLVGQAAALVCVCTLITACSTTEKAKPAGLVKNPELLAVRTAWSAAIGKVDFPLAVATVGNTAYLASSSGTVVALDARTGGDVWRVELGSPLTAGVGSDGRHTAVVNKENELVVLENGKESWRQKLGALTLTAPLVAGGRVFVLSADRTTAAFDALSGRRLWLQTRSNDSLVLAYAGVLTAVGDTLVSSQGGRLIGVNPQNGSIRWSVSIANSRGTNEVERLVDLVAGVSREGDELCARAFQSAVGCVDAARGRLVWTKPNVGATGIHGDKNTVFGVESNGRVTAWKRTDGERLWSFDGLLQRELGTPLLVGRALVVGEDDGTVHFLSAVDGSTVNRVPTDGSALAGAPLLQGATVILVTQRGRVLGLRPE